MNHGSVAVRVLHRKVKSRLVDGFGVYTPGLRRVGEGFLQFDKVCEVKVIEWIDLAEVASGIELVEPDLPGLGTLFK